MDRVDGDGDLVRQTLAGQTSAYEHLVRRWSARVLALCHARVKNASVAEDLAQETLLRGFRGLKTLTDPDRFGSWLFGIAVRTSLDWLKSSQRTEVSYDGLESTFQSPPSLPDEQDEVDQLMDAVHGLPEAYREVILLYYHDDRTYQELADLLGVSAATINARLTKGRALLREKMLHGNSNDKRHRASK